MILPKFLLVKALVSTCWLSVSTTTICLDSVMEDSYGDGWNGAEYTITSANDEVVVATGAILDDGFTQTDKVCLDAGCYTVSVSAGYFPEEITWSLVANNETLVNGGAPFGPWRFEILEEGELTSGCSICSCDSCVQIEMDAGAAYELLSSFDNSLISTGVIGASVFDRICLTGDDCYRFEVTGIGNWSIGSNNFAGSAPFEATHLTITDEGLVTQGCSGATCSSCDSLCVHINITSTATEGGGMRYELLEAGIDDALATWTLLPGEFEFGTAVCVNLPGGCHSFEVSGVGNWSIGELTGEAPYGPLYITIEEDGTLLEGCDEDYVGVCERSSCDADCDIDYINLGIQCTDFGYPETASACVCIEESARFIRNGTIVFHDGASVQSIVGSDIVVVATVVQQRLSLYVEGDDHLPARLDGNGTTRLFVVESDASLSVARLTLQNGYSAGAAGGGCILLGSYATLRLEGVVLKDCTALFSGGVLAAYSSAMVVASNINVHRGLALLGSGGGFLMNDGSRINVSNSSFDECSTFVDGGSIFVGKDGNAKLGNIRINDSNASQWGGGIYGRENSVIEIMDSRIKDCSANIGGGLLGFTGSWIFISNTDIVNCQASLDGGAVYGFRTSVIEVTDSRIGYCSADFGGGLFTESRISMDNTDIVYCEASQDGGGVYGITTSVIEVMDSRIENCSADFGGGLFTESRISIDNTDIVNCQASQYGGGVYGFTASIIEVMDSRVEDCSAEFGGGFYAFTESRIFIDNTDIVNCHASQGGGGVSAIQNSVIEVVDSRFEACSAEFGGGLYGFTDSQIYILNTNIVYCQASLGGGGVNAHIPSLIEVMDSQIEACSAEFGGGLRTRSRISINNTDIVNCQASQGGGLYGFRTSLIEVVDSRITNCTAIYDGGALYLSTKSQCVVDRSRLERNSATNGGAITFYAADILSIGDGVVFENNNAEGKGGSIYAISEDENNNFILVSSSKCTWVILEHDFEFNEDQAIQSYTILYSESNRNTNNARGRSTFNDVLSGQKIKYTYCLAPGEYTLYCYDTVALGWGTGRATLELMTVPTVGKIINKTFTCSVSSGNHIDAHSFVIPAYSNRASSAPLFRGNKASVGGSLYLDGLDLFLDEALLINNSAKRTSADEGGGAINANALSRVDATRSVFFNNSAQFALGGAIHSGFGSQVRIEDCMAIENAAQSGGFVSLVQTNDVSIDSTTIIDNKAVGGIGGGLYSRAQRGDFSVVSTTFRKNTATGLDSAGAAVGLQDVSTTFESASFEENTVRNGLGGGGIAILNSDAEFKETDDCISLEIHIDFRTTNQVCAVVAQGLTCDSFVESCSEVEVISSSIFNIDRACAGCACIEERGVHIFGNQAGSRTRIGTARAYAAAFRSIPFCLSRFYESYQIYAFDDLGRGLDDGSWSIVFLDSELPLDVAGFVDLLTTPDGATHYFGASFEGEISPEITFGVVAKDPEFSLFRNNHAEGGGGGALYIDQGVGFSDALPKGLEKVNFEENSAAYGSDIASPPRFLDLKTPVVHVRSGETIDPDGTLIVELRDRYNQTAASSSQVYLASVDVLDAISSAGTSVLFDDGYATFSDLLITKSPGTNVTVIISTNLNSLEPGASRVTITINLIECVSGEEQTKTQCIACPESEYSFYPEEPCKKCPDRGTCRGRNSIIPDRGFWKSAFDSTNIRRCPSSQACNSNNNRATDLLANNSSSHLHPNAQCASHHRGPLCATCENKYVLTSGECRGCRSSNRRNAIIAVIIVAIALLIIGVFIEFGSCGEACYAAGSLIIPYLSEIQSVVKQSIVFYDVTSKLSQTFPSVRVPPVFADFQIICAIFGLDIATYLRQTCFHSFDHIDLLYGVTSIPLGFIGIGGLLYLAIRQRWSVERRIKVYSNGSFALLVFMYLILTTTSTAIIRSLQCDNDFDDDSEKAHSPYYQDSYLYTDYDVSCKTRRWRVAQVYAIFMIFVYPIGIPLFYTACLFSIKDRMAPFDAREIADATIKTDSTIASREITEECKSNEGLYEHDGTLSIRNRVRVAVKRLKQKQKDYRAQQWKHVRHLATAYVDEDIAINGVHLSDESATTSFQQLANNSETIRKARLITLHEHLVKEHRALDKTCWPYRFLFEGYEINFWFWEVFECFRRIVLTCLLPIPGSDTDSFSQYILGAVFTLLSFGSYSYVKPFNSSVLNAFATFIQLLVVLNYMAMMLLYVDQNLSDEDDTTGLKSKHVGWFLIATNAIILPICSIAVCFIEYRKHTTFLFHQQSSRPLELVTLSSNQNSVEENKDESEHSGLIRVMSARNDDEPIDVSDLDDRDEHHDVVADVSERNKQNLYQDIDGDVKV